MATEPRVLVAVAWRPQPSRVVAHEATVARYRELLPDAEIVDVDTGHEPFCLAACRNKGVRLAERAGVDVVVLADADTLPEREPLLAAVEGASVSGLVHLPYDTYRSLRGRGSREYLSGRPLRDCDHLVVSGACSGVYVTTPATWWAHGGQDEIFRGWGAEDAAWYAAHTTLLGAEPVRHNGFVYALTHESAVKEGPQYRANFARCHRYRQAQGDPVAMWALVREAFASGAEDAELLGPDFSPGPSSMPRPAPPSQSEPSRGLALSDDPTGGGGAAVRNAARALIICAGEQERWKNHLGMPKHLAPLCGEPILHRTVRLARQYTSDVRVIVKNMGDDRYKVAGARRAAAKLDPSNYDADKFLSSRHLWSGTGRTVILYGDVWFSDAAMAQIFDPGPLQDGWQVFCRFGGSSITGAPGGENFAHVIDPPAHEAYEAALYRICDLRRRRVIWRNGGWEAYRAMCGLPDDMLLKHADYGHATVIDDWTEDMDEPGDYDGWCWRWAHADPATRPKHLGR